MTNRFPAYQYILTSFFLSGLSAFILQVSWERVLNRYIGVAIPTATLIVAIFMAGLGVGAISAGYMLRKGQSGLNIYASSLLFVSLVAVVSVVAQDPADLVLGSITAKTLSTIPLAFFFRVWLAVVFLLVPTASIGLYFPALVHYLKDRQTLKEGTSWLYCFNLLGAACGAILAGFVLIPGFGVGRAIFVAAGANILALLCLIPVYWRSNEQAANNTVSKTTMTTDPSSDSLESSGKFGQLLAVAAASGALSMVLEVAWIRLCMLVCGPSSYAFAITLSAQLLALAIGGMFSTFCLKRNNILPDERRAYGNLAIISLVASLSLYGSLYAINALPWGVYSAQAWFSTVLPDAPIAMFVATRVLAILSVILIPCLSLGGIFPTVLSIGSDAGQRDDHVVALYIANIAGAICGCVLGGLVLLPILAHISVSGIQMTLALSSLLALCICDYSMVKVGWTKMPTPAVASLILGLLLMFLLPRWDKELLASGASFLASPNEKRMDMAQFREFAVGGALGAKNIFYREGLNSTVSVDRIAASNLICLKTDGKMEAAVPDDPELPAPGSDIVSQVLLGSLPVLLCPVAAKDVLLIGMGSGVTSGAILDSREVENLTVAELEKSVLDAVPLFARLNAHAAEIKNAAPSSRVTLSGLDGRNMLSILDKRYQVIVSQPGEPWVAGSYNTYTREFWNLALSRLSAGGVFCQWIQLYKIDKQNLASLLATFRSVFPQTLVFRCAHASEIYLIGINGRAAANNVSAGGLISVSQIERRIKQESMRKSLSYIGIRSWPDLLSTLILTPQTYLNVIEKLGASTSIVSLDDKPLAEYAMTASLAGERGALDSSVEAIFTPRPFQFDQVYGDYGVDAHTQAITIARLACAYFDGDIAQASPIVAQDLLDQARMRANIPAIAALQQKGQGERLAEALLRESAQLESPRAALLFSRALLSEGRLDWARKCLVAASTGNAYDVDCLCALGNIELRLKHPQAAFGYFQQALGVCCDNPQAQVGAAMASVELGQYEAAVSYLKRALQVEPAQFEPRFLLGKLLCAVDREDEGLKQIVWASRLEPANAEPNLYVTAYYVAKLQWEAARRNLPLLVSKLPKDSRTEYLATKIRTLGPVDQNDAEMRKLLRIL